jgi:autotransporter translocation and assembly factor TamB
MPWWGWTVLALVTLIALAVLGGRVLVERYGPALARERVEAALTQALERPVRVGSVTLRPWLARVDVAHVAIAAGPAWSDGTLLDVESARVSLSIASVWRGELVARVVLDGVGLATTAGGGGTFELPAAIPDRLAVGPLQIAVGGVEIRRGTVSVRVPAAGRTIAITGLTATARPSGGGVHVTLGAATAALAAPAIDEIVEALSAKLRLHGDRLTIETLRARWRGDPVAIAGAVRGLGGAATLALTVEGTVPAPWLASTFAVTWPLSGAIGARVVLDGPLPAPHASAQLRIPELRAGPITARAVSAKLAWDGATLRVADVRAETLGGRASGTLAWSPAAPDATVGAIQLDGVALAELGQLAKTDIGRGTLTAAGELRGDPAMWAQIGQPAPSAAGPRGRFEITDARVTLPGDAAKLGAGTVRGELRVAPRGIEITRAEAHWPAFRIERLAGHVDTRGPKSLGAALTADAGGLASAFGAGTPVRGTATARVELDGRWTDLRATGEARAHELVVRDARLTGVAVDFALAGRTLRIADAAATLGSTRAVISATFGLPTGAALDRATLVERLEVLGDVRLPSARLEDFAPWIPAEWRGRGALAGTTQVEGTPAAWRARSTVTGGPIEVRGERIDALAAQLEATPSRLDVSRLTARVRDVPLRLAGSWRRDGVASVRGDAGPAMLAALPGLPPAAQLAGSATARGEADWRAGRWSGAATIEARDLRAAGVALGAGTVAVTLRDRDLAAAVRFPGARLTGDVTTTLDGAPAAVRASFTDLDLAPLLAHAPAIPAPVAPVQGTVSGTADITVPLDVPARATGTVRLDAVQLTAAGERWDAAAPAVIHREPGRTRIEQVAVRTVRAGSALRATGTIGDDGRLALTIDGRLGLAALPRLRPEIREAQGVLDATVSLGGSTSAVEARGQARLRDGRVQLRDVAHPLTDVQADLALVPGRVRVTAGRATALGSTVTVAGDVALTPAVRLDLTVHGDVPLSALAGLRPEILEARGTLAIDARVAGSPSQPEATGDATLRADSLVLRDYPIPLRDVRARLRATPARLALSEATASVGGGRLRARGDLAIQEWAPGAFAFAIEARQILLEPSPDFTTVWDADLELSGAGSRGRLHGEARLVRGAWVRETPLLRALLEPGSGGRAATGDGLGLAIRIDLGENLVVRTAVARFRARGTLDLQGTTAEPVVFGTVEAVDGHVAFRRHRFTLTRAHARFLDPRRIDPVLDVQGTTRIASYDVRLSVTGRTEELEVRLSSTPPLPEEDLLSLVAFGATRAELGQRGGTALAGEVASLILKDFFGVGGGEGGLGLVDSVELKTSDTSGRSVEVGKRVGNRATLRYSQGVDDSTERRLRVEYDVIGPVIIAGEQDFRGGFGADVLLRFRFR